MSKEREVRMNYVGLGQSWRHQNKILFNLKWVLLDGYENTYRFAGIHEFYAYIGFLALSAQIAWKK